jgi:hypothetical protein
MNTKMKYEKVVCSVSHLAQALGMSRSRFYQLVERGVFPQPLYDLRTKRPFYDLRLQETCREIKATGIGYDGTYVLFYEPRKTRQNPGLKPSQPRNSQSDTKVREVQEALGQMGVDVSEKDVADAVKTLYPGGIESQNIGEVIRSVFRALKRL